jgi:hypothetical protein
VRRIFEIGITDEKIKEAPIDKLILAAAVCIDKMLLLRSVPTSINQQRGGLTLLQQFNQQIHATTNGDSGR